MHHKFVVIDRVIIITGSYNWTYAAQYKNNENFLVIKNESLADKYIQEFERLLK